MIVLGVAQQHDSGAALIADGRILAAVNEERLNRRKLFWGWPERSISEVLRLSGTSPADVDHIAVANTTWSTCAPEWKGFYPSDLKRKALIQLSRIGIARLAGGTRAGIAAYRMANSKVLRPFGRRPFEQQLRSLGLTAPIRYIDHHEAHLASAYYTSGWDRCLNLSLDGVGDGYCSRIAVCSDGRMQPIHAIPFYHTPGQYYEFVTAWAGFTPGRHEGKITGLAAYGDPEKALGLFRERLSYSEDQFSFVNHGMWGWAEYERLCHLFDDHTKADVAAAVQRHLEEVVTAYVAQAVQRTGLGRVALSGGIFANVKLNQRIMQIDGIEDIYIHPNMGDGGLAVGSALVQNARHSAIEPSRIRNVYLGADFPDTDIEKTLGMAGLTYSSHDDVETEIARHLAEGRVVARVNGRMEYGPRSLGNRSILYQATDVTVNKWLNERLNRTEFMPFAPAILESRAADYYCGYPASSFAAEFMTITYDTTTRCKEEAPAIVHVDGTARPQTVSERTNPSLHRILTAYESLTGYPQVINTSFNMHEEPIVCTPEDAIRAFQLGHLDVLTIGNCIALSPITLKKERDARATEAVA